MVERLDEVGRVLRGTTDEDRFLRTNQRIR